jgi:succinate dehydrogenase hydrophobic anchor subunit
MHLLAAEVWHYWLSFAITGTVLLVLVAYFIGYLIKVSSNKYPKQ